MSESLVETLIDGAPVRWPVGGEFGWGEGPALCPGEGYALAPALDPLGYRVLDLPPGAADRVRVAVAGYLGVGADGLEAYHRGVDEAAHAERIARSRELRFGDLGLDPWPLIEVFQAALGVTLSPVVPALGRDHVQLRINRPGTTDYNPPHRDGALPIWAEALNLWLPVAGVDERTSLAILPFSHRIAEADCWQTRPGGAVIAGRSYRVPAITRLRDGPLRMRRAPVRLGQALAFTPFLIHGLGVNATADTTRMALEFRFQLEGRSPS